VADLNPSVLHEIAGLSDGQVELFDGDLKASQSWAESLRTNSICFCFNESGEALLMGEGNTRIYLRPQSLSLFTVGIDLPPIATRIGAGHHNFVLITVPRDHLSTLFGSDLVHLHPQFHKFIERKNTAGFGVVRPMWSDEKRLMGWFRNPPVPEAARNLWYQSKIGELFAIHLFASDNESFPVQQNRRSNQFSDRALTYLRENYEETLDLNVLAGNCGCSGPYLSRSVKRETGKTLQQHLRSIRIDAAARMLTGGANVTEAAFAVGYSSLSHFSKAFEVEKGLLPSEFVRADEHMIG
jgi:AraC-like DNA-binding protein